MFKNTLKVMTITMVSRVLGLFRTMLIAHLFGATLLTDAYFSAFKIANFFRQLLGEGALGTVFIPLYNEKNTKENEEKAKEFVFSILNILFLFLMLLSLGMFIFSKQIINFIVMGYSDSTKNLASSLLKIMIWYILFIGMAGMISAILNNHKKFFMPSFMSIMFNVSIITLGILGYKKYGIYSITWGVFAAGITQFLILLPDFFKIYKKYSFKINIRDPYLKKVFILMIPMLLGIFAKQINLIVDQIFGSFLEEGSISALENATRMYDLPLGIFGMSISTVIYPDLSRQFEKNNLEGVRKQLDKGFNFLIFFVIPSTFVLTIFSKDIINIIFNRGNFSERSIIVTAQSLFFYSLGLFFYTAIHLISRAFYSMKNTRFPVKISVLSIVLNILLNYILIQKYRHMGLALSTSISSAVNFIILYIVFYIKYLKLDYLKMIKFMIIVTIASLVSSLISLLFHCSILKIICFSVVYMGIWGYPLYKKRTGLF